MLLETIPDSLGPCFDMGAHWQAICRGHVTHPSLLQRGFFFIALDGSCIEYYLPVV